MHHSYWYFALIFLSTALFCFILFKNRNIQMLFLLLTITGFGFIIETVIFNFLGSYDYYPHFIKHPSFYDNNLGAFVSNAFCLPVVAVLIAVFRLNWIWVVLFSGLFTGIEWLFLKLHIFSHNWWRLAFTALGLPFYFAAAKVFYRWILHPIKGFRFNWILYLIIITIACDAHILPIIFFSNRIYQPGWFEDPGRDSIALAAIFFYCSSLFFCLIVKLNWKIKWLIYLLTGLLMFAVSQVLIGAGLLDSLVWWDQPYYICVSLFLLFLTGAIDKRLSTGDR